MAVNVHSKAAFTLLRTKSVIFLRKQLKAKDKFATGTTYRSIRGRITLLFSKSILDIYANESLIWIDRGRKAGGKMPPKQAITDWVKARNIQPSGKMSQESLVFLIRRKIARDGIKPTPIFKPFSLFLIGTSTRVLQKAFGRDINSQFLNGVRPFVDNPSQLSVK